MALFLCPKTLTAPAECGMIFTNGIKGGSEMLQIQQLTKRYGEKTAVDALTLTIRPGEIFGFIGPNGAGKTFACTSARGSCAPLSGTTVRVRPLP